MPARERLRATFDADPLRYDRARPGYPPALVAALLAALPGRRVLEVGPGTGQLTAALAAAGVAVTAVELGPGLAALLRERVPGARVVVGAFEDQPPPSEPFDALLAATAWHWLDPQVRTERAGAALRQGGVLVTVTTAHVAGGTQAFFAEAQPVHARYEPGEPAVLPMPTTVATRDEVDGSPLFEPATRRVFTADIGYDAAAYIDVLGTYSNVLALPAADRAGLLADLTALVGRHGGRIVKRYAYELRVARRSRR